jgi:hypothetical protein
MSKIIPSSSMAQDNIIIHIMAGDNISFLSD